MKLYWWPKTRAIGLLWMMEELGEPYQRVAVDIASGLNDLAFRKINPMAKLPAFEDGAVQMGESAAICCYLADRYPGAGLAPAIGDPQRGRYLQWLFFSPACLEPAYAQKFTGMELPPRAAGWGDVDRVINVLDEALTKGPWLLGDRFTAADVMIGIGLHTGVDKFKIVEGRPSFRAYIDRCLARPAYARAKAIDDAGV